METGDRRFLLRVVAGLLIADYGTKIMLLVGKSAMCIWRSGCSLDEQKLVVDFLNSSTATLVALLLAFTK